MQDPLASWAAIISAIATFIVAILTFYNSLIAQKSLKLMQIKESRSLPSLDVYYFESVVIRSPQKNIRLYLVRVQISNISDSDNSIKEVNLVVNYDRNNDVKSNVAIPSLSENLDYYSNLTAKKYRDLLETPALIKSHTVKTGWMIFKIEDEFFHDALVNSYEIKVVDTHDCESSLKLTIFREEIDEEKTLA